MELFVHGELLNIVRIRMINPEKSCLHSWNINSLILSFNIHSLLVKINFSRKCLFESLCCTFMHSVHEIG